MGLHARAAPGAKKVRIGNNHVLPSRFSLTVDSVKGEPALRMDFEVTDGVPQCRAVHVAAVDGGREVRRSDLRKIPVEELLESTASFLAYTVPTAEDGSIVGPARRDHNGPLWRGALREVRTRRRDAPRRSITDGLLREVARVYRENVDNNPTKCVAEKFGKSPRMARLYVQQARERGFLGPAIKGKAGER